MTVFSSDLADRGLRWYVDEVARALGIAPEETLCELTPPTAYIALTQRVPQHPDRDVALLWDGRRGWWLAAERSGLDPVVVTYLLDEVLPPADAVAEAARAALAGRLEQRSAPARHEPDLRQRLSSSGGPHWRERLARGLPG